MFHCFRLLLYSSVKYLIDLCRSSFLWGKKLSSFYTAKEFFYGSIIVSRIYCLKTVPTFVSACTFCASRTAWNAGQARVMVEAYEINYTTKCKIVRYLNKISLWRLIKFIPQLLKPRNRNSSISLTTYC